jgi:hypothetical protein
LKKYTPAVIAMGSDTIPGVENACKEFDAIYGNESG